MGFLNRYNFKIYIIIILFSVFVVLLGINTYINSKFHINTILNQSKEATSQNIVNIFSLWLNERIASLEKASKFITNADILDDDKKLKNFTQILLNEFDLIQLLKEDGEIYINGDKFLNPKEDKALRLGFLWYLDAKNSASAAVNFMPKHSILDEETLNLCVPNYKNNNFSAVLCGVVKLKSIFDIVNLKLPPNSYSFIVTHSGQILTNFKDERLKNEIEKSFTELFLKEEDITSLTLGSNFISIAEIPSLNWFIGAGTDNTTESKELLAAITKHGVILLFAFIVLALIANYLHNFMYKKIKKKQDEYEILLSHKNKMSETGELISGINHQFIQPVNSLNLMISTLLMLKKDRNLDEKTLQDMLEKGQKSVALLNSTIEIFRNFYKTSENITNFSINQSIKNILTLMHTELTRANVHIILKNFKDKNITQIENIIQQILIILIHNAKDALVDKFKDDITLRRAFIEVDFKDQRCFIRVSEFGSGVSENMSKKIFSEPKTTKKQGSGIGLYFAKKLANEKINGDIKLINRAEPTIFELSFDINLKGDK